jgi:4-amino-4-deoxy-L-arabinose transferase-like glycosyltransferase
MITLAVALTVLSDRYGYERDELYFRMLRPAWGYVDQPPLTPWLARLTMHLSDSPASLRMPATAAAVVSVLIAVLITREFGGDRRAQLLCAWSYAFAATPLVFGHVLLTSSLDLVSWPLASLFVIRAIRRAEPRWWVAAGITLGLSTYNKLLIVTLVIALVAGLLITGPRRVLVSRWVLIGAGLALLIAAPNLVYQATHSWPQLTMGRALTRENAGSVRLVMWPYLILLLGPPLVPIWVAGLVGLTRRADWRPVRFLAPAFGVLLIEAFISGGQLYYPVGLLVVIYAIGCVPAAAYLARSRPWRCAAAVLIPINALVSAVIALPILPLSVLANSPVPGINSTVGDQIGWPDYVAQVASVYRTIPVLEQNRTAIIATNYGEAGAIARYGPAYDLPHPYSGHNQLYFDGRPPRTDTTALVIGSALTRVRPYFAFCTTVSRLRDGSGVDNEEQGEPVSICREPNQSWSTIWPALQHYD